MPPRVVQRALTIGEDDDEIKLIVKFLPPIKNRQKTTLTNLLGTLNSQKAKFGKLQLALSSKGALAFGLADIEALEVLLLLNTWAGDGTQRAYNSWDAAVAAAAKIIKSQSPLSLLGPSTSSKLEGKQELPTGFQLFDFSFCTAYPGGTFTLDQYKSIASTSVNIHGETQGGTLVTTKNLQLGAERCYKWRNSLHALILAAAPCAAIFKLSRKRLLLTVMTRIVAGSVQEGKCILMVRCMQQIFPVLTGLKYCFDTGRVRAFAWLRIKELFQTVFWGAQQKNMTKVCRELGSALQILQADPALALTGYEQKDILSSGELSELDLEFCHFDQLAPPQLINFEIESEKEGTKNSWDFTSIQYYGDRWAGKARRFQLLGKHAKLAFMVAPHPGMPLDFPELIETYVWLRYKLKIKVVTPLLIELESIHRQVISLRLAQRPPARQRSRSLGSSGDKPPGRGRSASL